jgi:hypothetical protein
MSRKYLIAGVCIIIMGIALALWYFNPLGFGAGSQSASAVAPYVVPPIQNHYRNDALGFSIGLPDGFVAQESEEESGVKTVVLQDAQGNGIQILATPLKQDIPHLSIDMVKRDIPDMVVSDVQPVEIGEGRTGVAFKSDNEAFGGASREVWFAFRGNLYQISTYERLDELLQSMFASWTFI